MRASDPDIKPPLYSRDPAIAVLTAAFDGAAQAELTFGLLRPKELTAEAARRGDYDCFCSLRAWRAVLGFFFEAAREHGAHVLVERGRPHKWVLRIMSDLSPVTVLVEVWTTLELTLPGGRRAFLPASALARFTHDGSLAPSVAAAIYLTHLRHKRKDLASGEVRERLGYYAGAVRGSEEAPGSRGFGASTVAPGDAPGEALAAQLERLLDTSPGEAPRAIREASDAAVGMLKEAGVRIQRDPLLRMRNRLMSVRRRTRGLRRHPIISVLGPDGSGKTTVVDTLFARHGFRRVRVFRFKVLFRVLFRRLKGGKQNLLEERRSSLCNFIAFWVLAAARVLYLAPEKWIIDRYFYDYYYRGIRNRRKPVLERTSFARHLARVVPKPELIVVCHCPESLRLERKPKELRSESAEHLYAIYLDQIASGHARSAFFYSTATPLEAAGRGLDMLAKKVRSV